MGSSSSKDMRSAIEAVEEDNKKTPISPPYRLVQCDDPRSPTTGLDRTPIEVFSKRYTPMHLPLRKWSSDQDLTPLKSRSSSIRIIDDPRSPTEGIIRTPIQVTASLQSGLNTKLSFADVHKKLLEAGNYVHDSSSLQDITDMDAGKKTVGTAATLGPSENVLLDADGDPLCSAPYTALFKTLAKLRFGSGPLVYEDNANSADGALKNKKEIVNVECHNSSEKENDTYKRKLSFTPETRPGLKVRTPLGPRCNFQDSPSQVLKMKHVQKVDQELGNDVENSLVNSFGSTDTPVKLKKLHHIDWDNKDSTLIM